MQRLALPLLSVLVSTALLIAPPSFGATTLIDGGFETTAAWAGPASDVTASAADAGVWWTGPDTGEYCAGDADGYYSGAFSGGLLQFVAVNGMHSVSLSFDYLLWRGEYGSTKMHYAVYGWEESDSIDLTAAGPGADATAIIGPTLLTSPVYSGAAPPKSHYTSASDTGAFAPGAFDYVGVWIDYRLLGGSFYIDNVQMELLPEPATLSLLGLGGIVLLRRRR